MEGKLEWHKFTKKNMPVDDGAYQILVCRDYGNSPFFVTVTVDCGMYTYCKYDGIHMFEPDRRDRWTYLEFPEGAVRE